VADGQSPTGNPRVTGTGACAPEQDTCSCAGMADASPSDETRSPAWWKQSRWQLLATCYALLVAGLVLEYLLHQTFASTVAFGGAILSGGYPSARGAWVAVKKFQLSIGALVLVGALGAVLLGLWEEAAALVAIYSLGGLVEARVLDRAHQALREVGDLAPRLAQLVTGGTEVEVPVESVRVGDLIRVRPGTRIPIDGLVVDGHSAVDESPMTGEPIPVDKGPGDPVMAGTVNHNGALLLRTATRAQDSSVAQVIRAVEEARRNKSRLEGFGERFGAIYTPAMFAVALAVATIPALLGLGWIPWVYRALVVLVISCSCGLLMSVPTATLAAVTAGARRGLVVKGGRYLEAASHVDVVVLDKTGTLSTGRPSVTAVNPKAPHTAEDVLGLAAAVESSSEHPLGRAIVSAARHRGLNLPSVPDFEADPGRGACATVNGRKVWVGSSRWARESGVLGPASTPLPLAPPSGTRLVVWDSDGLIGTVEVRDTLRAEARDAVNALRAVGMSRIVVMTGDTRESAEATLRDFSGIELLADLLPVEKAAQVRHLQTQGHTVAFVGDGINDAPALAQADLGIAMGLRGTDIARATCDVVLMDDDLRRLPEVLQLGRRATRIMREDVVISIALVGVLVGAALLGLVGLVAAIALNEGSAVAVTANGLRLTLPDRSLMGPGEVPSTRRSPAADLTDDLGP
jgi:Cd2+/Zn2+-exporting ATPase